MLNTREKEIYRALMDMGIGRLDPERFPTREVDALLYKGLKALVEKESENAKDSD